MKSPLMRSHRILKVGLCKAAQATLISTLTFCLDRETEAAAAVAALEAPSGSAAGSVFDETHGGVFPKFCGERPGNLL